MSLDEWIREQGVSGRSIGDRSRRPLILLAAVAMLGVLWITFTSAAHVRGKSPTIEPHARSTPKVVTPDEVRAACPEIDAIDECGQCCPENEGEPDDCCGLVSAAHVENADGGIAP